MTSAVDSILQRILQKCFAHPSISPSSCSLTSQCSSPHLVANVILPDAPSLKPTLIAAGAQPEISLAIDQAYQKRAADLRALCCRTISHLCSAQGSPDPKIVSVFTELYLRELVSWREEVVALYLKHPAAGDKSQISTSLPKFNHEYVPLLEHFFNENPFPTHADKAFLAKKSRMTYRQIHVWFQNRRNRTKREGKVLRRKPMSEGITLPLGPLLQSMEKFIVPEEQRENASPLGTSDLTTNNKDQSEVSPIADSLNNALDSPAPPHAFPSPFPPTCSYDPFPFQSGKIKFGVPKWPRTPMKVPVQHPAVDFDWLIGQFSRMNVVDDSTRGKVDSFAAVAAITIRPLSAPHPALIRGTAIPITRRIVSLLSIPANASRQHIFNTPSPQSRPVTLIPSSETPTTRNTRRRKVMPLPRRVPYGNPISHHDVTSPLPLSPSRLSSFGSDSSSQGRLFSTMSSTSGSSSSVVTPPSSSPSPPAQLSSPSASLSNLSSSMIDLFGDALQGTPSTERLQPDLNSSFWENPCLQKLSFSFNAPSAANLVRTQS